MTSLATLTKQTFQKHPNGWAVFLLCLLGLVAFGNAFPNSFHFDDIVGVVRNPVIRDLKNIPAFFTDPTTFGLGRTREWRPILQITYAVNYYMGGLNPAIFRSFNFLFHLGAAFLIFLIVKTICRQASVRGFEPDRTASFLGLFAALLFVVHTANSEVVNYIWARSSLLATFLCLLSFYCYLRGPFSQGETPGWPWHIGALVSFGLAVATKATATTLPALLAIYEFLFLNPHSKNPFRLFRAEPRRLIKYIPLGVVFLAYVALRMALFPRMVTGRFAAPSPTISPYAYLLTQFRAWIYYIKLFVWPHPLLVDFAGFGWSHSLWDGRVLWSLCLIVALLAIAWTARRHYPLFSFFLFWYFIALLPEASIIPLEDAVVGYRAYPAYVGLAVVGAILIGSVPAWISRPWWLAKPVSTQLWYASASIAAVVVVSLTVATIARNLDWRNETTLWTDVMRKDPSNPRPHMSLGLEKLVQGDYPAAQEFFDKAIQLNPRSSHAFVLRGYLSFRQDKIPQALADYTAALKLDPRDPYAFFYRGELHRRSGESDKALADYQAALKFMPYYTDAYLGMAMAYLDEDNAVQATTACARIVEIDPQDRRGYDCLGTLLLEQNLLADALRVYRQAVERQPMDGELWQGLGTAYAKLGMHREAQHAFAKAAATMAESRRQSVTDTPLLH